MPPKWELAEKGKRWTNRPFGEALTTTIDPDFIDTGDTLLEEREQLDTHHKSHVPPRYSHVPLRSLADELQIDVGYLSRVSRGLKPPSLNLIREMARVVGVPEDYFLEYRQAAVFDHLRHNPDVVNRLYRSISKTERRGRSS
jgi:transcriptional regulator with XRE-family HTH domain